MKRDAKRMERRGKDISKLDYVISVLASGKSLPPKNKDHRLKGI